MKHTTKFYCRDCDSKIYVTFIVCSSYDNLFNTFIRHAKNMLKILKSNNSKRNNWKRNISCISVKVVYLYRARVNLSRRDVKSRYLRQV